MMASAMHSDGPVSVLVVDDRERSRAALVGMLDGYRVVEAASGREALRRLLDEDFALLFIDASLQEMSGVELASIIKERDRTAMLPIVFLMAKDSDVPLVYKGGPTGVVDYLVKPLVREMVRAKVEVFAKLHRQRLRIEHQAALLLESEKRDSDLRVLELRLAAERHFQSLADAMPQIVWVGRSDGSIEYLNRRWFEYTRLSADPSERSLLSVMHPEDAPRWQEGLLLAGREGRTCERAVRLRAADGSYRWHLGRAVAEHGANGRVTSWTGTFTDIEEQKRIEHEKELAYEAAAAVRARDEFLSVASHELRTPLSSIQLQIDLLLSQLGRSFTTVQLQSRLEATARQIRRLAQLITELLEVSRITTGHLRLDREELDLVLLTNEVVARLDMEATRAGCHVSVHADGPVAGFWDRFRLDQVVTNLLTNAFKFGAKKPVEVRVNLDESRARLTVRDHGIGIGTADIDRIFQRFEQAVSGRTYGGLGLGLFIVRQITDAHDGTVIVSSEPGQGSMFTIELPRDTRVRTRAVIDARAGGAPNAPPTSQASKGASRP